MAEREGKFGERCDVIGQLCEAREHILVIIQRKREGDDGEEDGRDRLHGSAGGQDFIPAGEERVRQFEMERGRGKNMAMDGGRFGEVSRR